MHVKISNYNESTKLLTCLFLYSIFLYRMHPHNFVFFIVQCMRLTHLLISLINFEKSGRMLAFEIVLLEKTN